MKERTGKFKFTYPEKKPTVIGKREIKIKDRDSGKSITAVEITLSNGQVALR